MRAWILAGVLPFAPAGSVELRFARGVFWSVGGAIASQVLGMIASFVTARLLGKVGVGEVGIVRSTLGAFGVFAGFGLGLTSTKYVAEFRLTNPGRAGRILGLSRIAALSSGAIITVVLFLVAENLASGM
jgi:O-antigen/teichoic acid export membrane protein